jgi:hypothetical protein
MAKEGGFGFIQEIRTWANKNMKNNNKDNGNLRKIM